MSFQPSDRFEEPLVELCNARRTVADANSAQRIVTMRHKRERVCATKVTSDYNIYIVADKTWSACLSDWARA